MRAISAFLNGAGSRRNFKGGGPDRGLLKLMDLFVNTGFASRIPYGIPYGVPVRIHATQGMHPDVRAPARRSQRFPR
jgi:hypothetical protein